MFYIGSHKGSPDDGYISSSRWLNGEINYRPTDFRRKIIKQLPLEQLKKEEYRLISMISEDQYGRKYYNIKSGQKPGSTPWNKGKSGIYTADTRKKMSDARKGKPTTKGRKNPLAAENARRGSVKLSQKVTGRKLHTREDGSRYWVYPEAS
jgi:hypothetical protein